MGGGRKLLPRTAGLYTAQFVTESTVPIQKEGFSITVSLDGVTKMARVPSTTEPTAGRQDIATQSGPGMHRNVDGNKFFWPSRNDPGHTDHAVYRNAEHRGPGKKNII